MKELKISVSDKDHELLVRICKHEKRKLSDLQYLLLAEGIRFFFTETHLWIEKTDDELTKEEKEQIALNKKIEKKTVNFWQLEEEERKAKGYKHVRKYLCNMHSEEPEDDLIKPLANRIENYVLELPNEN